jgi:hypothetical protein
VFFALAHPDTHFVLGQDCGTIKPANVNSTSYGYNEADLSPAYTARQCAEYAKVIYYLHLLPRLLTPLYSLGSWVLLWFTRRETTVSLVRISARLF